MSTDTVAASAPTASESQVESQLRQLSAEQVREFFAGHRTVRHYQTGADGQPVPLPPEHLDAVLYAAQRAPTHSTSQLYSIIQVQHPQLRTEMATLTQNAHIATAGAAFVLCADMHRTAEILALASVERGEWPEVALHFALGDAVMAGQNLLTAAEMLGYQGCWIGGVLNHLPEIVSLLQLPTGVLPFAALTVGLSAETGADAGHAATPYRPRLSRETVVHTDHYREPSPAALQADIRQMNPIADRPGKPGDWVRLLQLYWGKGGGMEGREASYRAVKAQQGFTAQTDNTDNGGYR